MLNRTRYTRDEHRGPTWNTMSEITVGNVEVGGGGVRIFGGGGGVREKGGSSEPPNPPGYGPELV